MGTIIVPFTSSYPQHCLIKLPLSLTRRICIIIENENVNKKRFKELKKTLVEQKYPKFLVKASLLKAKKYLLKF